MLWKKESRRDGALYTDILSLNSSNMAALADGFIRQKSDKPFPRKDNAIAIQKREEGNRFFRSKMFSLAMELYNESLCFAEPGSENVSFAYANRSSCFLNMSMYDKCLKDIDLAKEAGYPDHLMHKIDGRKEICLKRLEDGYQSHKIGAELDFEADEQFPCMANVLKIQKDNMGKFSVVAKEDIDVDKTVVMQKSFCSQLAKRFGLKCNICLNGLTNLVACKKCAVAMFCDECQNDILHEYECGLNICGPSAFNNDILYEARMALMAIELFPSIDELMEFVEQILKSDAQGLPESMENSHARFRAFFLSAFRNTRQNDDLRQDELTMWIYCVYKTILKIPRINAKFQTQKQLRFLMHLIGHHSKITSNTEHFGCFMEESADEKFENPLQFSNQVFLMDKYFEHSCAPNLLSIAGDGKDAFITIKPIKRGERLNITYIPLYIDPNSVRQQHLRDRASVTCDCVRCRGIIATSVERRQLSTDASFRFLLSNEYRIGFIFHTSEDIREMIEHCVIVLKQYGRMKWCDEIKKVFTMYQALLHIRMVGSTHPRIDDPNFIQSRLRQMFNISNN